MTGRARVAGVDSSTQSCKYIVVEASTGELVSSTAVPHLDGTSVDPERWWDALESVGAVGADDLAAISITAQQHTTIFLDETGQSVRDALLWNDLRSAAQARDLRAELGPGRWVDEVGSLPTAAHPVAKLRWLAENEPSAAERVSRVLVPHDWLTWNLLARAGEPTTDRSDASGTGYWSPASNDYRPELLRHSFGRLVDTPRVLRPSERAGVTTAGVVVGAGCGDNAAALLGLDAQEGEAIVSVGTSLTVSTMVRHLVADPSGHVSAMADATGAHLPIVATLNGARTLSSVARLLQVGIDELDQLALRAAPDADGLTFVPYLDGERTPFLPEAHGALLGMTRRSMHPKNLARAAVLGLACAISAAIADLQRAEVPTTSIVMIGGGATCASLRQAVADLTGRTVLWPERAEYAALGAARQAAWALTGELPTWPKPRPTAFHPRADQTWTHSVLARYEAAVQSLPSLDSGC